MFRTQLGGLLAKRSVVICDFEGHMRLFAVWPMLPYSSQIVVCIRGQLFRLWPLDFQRALAIGALVFNTGEAHSAFVACAAALDASGLGTFGC